MNQLIKTLFLSFAVFGLFLGSFAHPVDLETAQSIAAKFMGTNDLQLSTTYTTDKSEPTLYIFNTSNGFVIVSADDCETPIIGYSYEGRFDPNDVPVQMEDYLKDFVERIQYGIENHIEANETTTRQWELVKATGQLNNRKDIKSVEPLLTEMWEQGCHYNNLCPTMGKVPCGHAEVGCVAVAMGQIMHYWRYPTTGWGSHSYYHMGDVNATLSADFGNTVYDWDHMPDSLTENSSEVEIEAVATLLFHCGVSVEMHYSFGGSSSSSNNIPDALIRYFNYSRHLHREIRADFSDEEWLAMIKSDLDLQRPVQYSGSGSGGHAFVCDGYDANDLLHFNWGWGRANGYFALGHLNPIGYHFNDDNSAIFGIVPQYEPWLVTATVYPPNTGSIIGTGEYHIGDNCKLTAVPSEQHEFYCWKKDGQIVTYNPVYTVGVVEDDMDGIEAVFTLRLSTDITATYYPDPNNPECPSVILSWGVQNPNEWMLLKEFEVGERENGVGSDGEYIYTSCDDLNYPSQFGKYDMDGELLDVFGIEGCGNNSVMAFDGNYFYFPDFNYNFYCVDMVNKEIINSMHVRALWHSVCAFDPISDGFWCHFHSYPDQEIRLIDRSGHTLHIVPNIPFLPYGSCLIMAKDGTRHLLLFENSGKAYDYDITNDILKDYRIYDFHHYFMGSYVGQYEGKEALFIVYHNMVHIYEFSHHLSQITGYRIYRADSEANTIMLADGVTNLSYIDTTWYEAYASEYRFGVSSVFSNGVESEIIWSDPIVKTDIGLPENENDLLTDPSVQKVIEDGKIVIIKDGKRYSVSGQHLN